MRVLHVIPSVSSVHGGPSNAILTMERVLAERGIAVTTATTDDDGPGRRRPKFMQEDNKQVGRRIYFRKWFDFYKVSPRFASWIFQHVRDYDVVHIHALFSFTSMAAAWAARRAGVPYVLRPLGTLARYGVTQRRPWLKRVSLTWLEGPALRAAAAVHFTSLDEQCDAAQTGIPMNGVVIPLGIDAFKLAGGSKLHLHLHALQGSRYLLYLSRLDPKKNVENLLRAFSLCVADWPSIKLLIAGDGAPAYVAGLKLLADELNLVDSVVWGGHIEGDLKASALEGAEFFVLPSFSENFGIAAAEALMAGLPCVLGQGVAIATDVVEAGAGVAVLPDPESIAAGMIQIMNSPAQRATMAANAISLASSKYSAEAMGEKLVQLYSQISTGVVPFQKP